MTEAENPVLEHGPSREEEIAEDEGKDEAVGAPKTPELKKSKSSRKSKSEKRSKSSRSVSKSGKKSKKSRTSEKEDDSPSMKGEKGEEADHDDEVVGNDKNTEAKTLEPTKRKSTRKPKSDKDLKKAPSEKKPKSSSKTKSEKKLKKSRKSVAEEGDNRGTIKVDEKGEDNYDVEAGGVARRQSKQLNRAKSKLPASEDPFAARDGKTLLWRNINMTLKDIKGKEDRKLLEDVWGEVPERQATAIMGPSGAGKTSLLNILAGRAASRGNLSIEADVRLNNFAVDPTNINVRRNIAFVAQDDSLQATSTPREAIYFSAKLRLPKSTSEKNLIKLVDRMLEELGLSHCADTIVGGLLIKGISGGERKRTSVGVELVVRPAMVFLDEPTSGLDSFSAIQLCQVLKKVANAGASVLFTIHQPASEIFNSFDRLILMNKGRVMYQGLVEDVPRYFEERGQPLPPKYNPADWIMNVAQSLSLEELNTAGFFPKDERELPDAFTDHVEGKDELGMTLTQRTVDSPDYDNRTVGMMTQIGMLFSRELKNLVRDKTATGGRFGFSLVLATLIGVIFYNVGEQPLNIAQNLNSAFGALIMVTMMAMFGTAQQALLAFPQERPVFLREYSTNHYSVVSYFLSRFTVEAVTTAVQTLLMVVLSYLLVGFQSRFGWFYLNVYALAMASTALSVTLGCAIEDPKLGQEMLPILFVPQLLFAGFFVSPSLIPAWLRWARYIFPLTYSVRLGLVYEFGDGCGGEEADDLCVDLLESVDADPDDAWWYWLAVLSIFVFFRLLALFILQRKATKFF